MIQSLFTKVFTFLVGGSAYHNENKAISHLYEFNDPEPLIKLLEDRRVPFRRGLFGVYTSDTGRITVKNNIYGYDAKLDRGKLINYNSSYYMLSRTQGNNLFKAILSNIPGSVYFIKKLT